MTQRILVVDDKIERRRWLKKLLVQQGYAVRVAKDGISALHFL